MPLCKTTSTLLVLSVVSLCVSDGDVVHVSGPDDTAMQQQPVFLPAAGSSSRLSLLAAYPEDLEISEYCLHLRRIFQDRYISYVTCLVPSSRPVKLCLNCLEGFARLSEIYTNISNDQMGPGNCSDSLLRSDRLMLIFRLYVDQKRIWEKSACDKCVIQDLRIPTNDTLYFMNELNQTLSCFEKYQQGNYSDLCRLCKSKYESLSGQYGLMEKNQSLCIDIEDAMNMTRRLWSKNYNCIYPREETIPVIAVSCFMLFLPIIFYLSSYLHSEQKKLKLIHPKRAKSNNSLMNIQDKFS
ncbi:unnamed protein product [Merluccius merluccius]